MRNPVVVIGLGLGVGVVAAAALVSGSLARDPGCWGLRSSEFSGFLAPVDCSIAALRCTLPDADAGADAGPDGRGVLLAMVLVPGAG